MAQNVTGTGTSNTIALFTGNSTLGSSNIVQADGNVGVGTASPGYPLQVVGEIASIGANAGFRVASGSGDDVNNAPWYGVGLTNLPGPVNGGDGPIVQVAGFFGLQFQTANGQMVMRGDSGNLGIGTATPAAKLEVNGNVKLTAGSGASVTYPDGTVQSTAWNGTTLGGDYAESIDVQGDRAAYEPGDVIAIDDSVTGQFQKSDKAYSKLVAGVFSTKPGLVGRRTTAGQLNKEAEVPMAMMGVVPTKVSMENGPIARGDLLVSSSTPGYAMKGTDSSRMLGAVIGKALAPLRSDLGVIEVLVSLQ